MLYNIYKNIYTIHAKEKEEKLTAQIESRVSKAREMHALL